MNQFLKKKKTNFRKNIKLYVNIIGAVQCYIVLYLVNLLLEHCHPEGCLVLGLEHIDFKAKLR